MLNSVIVYSLKMIFQRTFQMFLPIQWKSMGSKTTTTTTTKLFWGEKNTRYFKLIYTLL